jgi:3-oxoacyl-[acyl-carrier-protein] synthase II
VTALVISGWGALCAGGIGPAAVAAALLRPATAGVGSSGRSAIPGGSAVPGFDAQAVLGRKGTSFLDRGTALALAATDAALRDGAVTVDDRTRERIGIVFGTTAGSLKSTMDFSRETLVQPRPYLVNAMLFPNTVMNCATGQAAIRFGLRGINTTIAGGALAFLQVLRYAGMALRRRYADTLLVGAAEELTAHTAWSARLVGAEHAVSAGEGAAVFVLHAAGAELGSQPIDADVPAVATGYAIDGDVSTALRRCTRRALVLAETPSQDVALLATGEAGADRTETEAVVAALGTRPATVRVKDVFGDCLAATGALQVAAVLAAHRDDPGRDGQAAVVTARSHEGGVGAAVLRGWSRARADCG